MQINVTDVMVSSKGMVWVRCQLIRSMICEDVLELALAALPEDDGSLGQ